MDDLDRLAFRLVRTIRQRFPQLREQGFTLTDVEETLLPFREARREMADGSAESWEITVLRLLSGERGYIDTDEDLRDACNNSLSLPSPTISLVRCSPSILTLGPAALQIGNERVSGAFDAVRHPPNAAATSRADATPIAAGLRPVALVTPPKGHCGCRFCGGRLPEGRIFTFCPHCGLDLSKRQCPACSTSLEVQWRFCVTCGRSTELPEYAGAMATPVTKAS